ncbi:MAG: molybdate ABC transporter substrate-binding protein [Acidobacteriaceae bacterium]|nr:molybdate ABC transporter substrate-binding protein [Acidobacteriaceae bacterium]
MSIAQTALTVAAASDLSALGPELQEGFCKEQKQCSIRLVNASSSVLSQQIENGAPFDVFMSANAEYADRLGHSGKLLPSSVRVYAIGRVGVLWRDGKKHPLRELATAPIKFVALPNPKLAPYGVAAQQALEYAGLWTMVQPKVVYGENVRQTLQLLESGNADAVLTADSLLQGKDAEVIPADWHQPILQKAGLVTASPNRELARRFLDFLVSAEGQAVFALYGFSPPQK